MLTKLINIIIGDYNQKEIKKATPLVDAINIKEIEYQSLTDEQLKSKTDEFVLRVKNGESLDDILVEAFATVKNACRRLVGTKFFVGKDEKTWDMIPYDCQLLGGIMLHKGRIAEMKTGEGKTLVACLPTYLNALSKNGSHLVTVNDYLAKRDAEWMKTVYNYLGLSVGVILHDLNPEQRKAEYACDITYGTNNEFGFDYLRDNMARNIDDRVQRGFNYAIVDEVDSILIDEARTPLIISAPAEESTKKYYQYAQLINNLVEGDHYKIDEKSRSVTLTEPGIAQMEKLLGVENIYTDAGFLEVHHIEQSLKAKAVFKRDIDYLVKDGEILIVDEFTGRLMPGRRYSDGLHQAIEAKENVEVKRESKTLATVTFQNFFRLYKKLSGMTGTAKTEEEEFFKIYGLETIVIPTNRPVQRQDMPDQVFKNNQGKWIAVAKAVKEYHDKGQPVLVGTVSVEKSEMLSKLLKMNGITHDILNAKHHEREAEIVAGAGKKGSVTIATNMAGRGTDIKLTEEVVNLGGLVIIGTERHDSRRIDNQLRGRSGRQGDPGVSRFYVSMDDDLMRLFGSDKIKSMMDRLGLPDDMPIENIVITKSIESAQKRVEGHNFDIRKHLLEYDDVMNKHREIIYSRRLKILENDDLSDDIYNLIKIETSNIVSVNTSSNNKEDWDMNSICNSINSLIPNDKNKIDPVEIDKHETSNEIQDNLYNILISEYKVKENSVTDIKHLRLIEKRIYLHIIDSLWMDHIDQMTQLRESVSLRGYAQRDPLMEYKQEAFFLFKKLLDLIQRNVVNTLFKLQIRPESEMTLKAKDETKLNVTTNAEDIENSLGSIKKPISPQSSVASRVVNKIQNVVSTAGRNDVCPCGSGKKYKKCCG